MSDPFIDQTIFLLHADGANGSTDFADATRNALVFAKGDARVSTAQSKFGGAALLLDGVGDYLATPASTFPDFAAADFTIEGFVFALSLTDWQTVISKNPVDQEGAWRLLAGAGGSLAFGVYVSGAWVSVTASSAGLPLNTWAHVAVCRSGNTATIFLDGLPVGSSTAFGFSVPSLVRGVLVGAVESSSPTWFFNGYMDELRITRAARYTSAFTPPAAPFDAPALVKADDLPHLWDQTRFIVEGEGTDGQNDFIDARGALPRYNSLGNVRYSTAQKRFGTSSIYFDGAGDYLQQGGSPWFLIGADDFVVEAFVLVLQNKDRNPIFTFRGGVSSNNCFTWFAGANGKLQVDLSTSGTAVTHQCISPDGVIVAGKWHHVALERFGGVLTQYVDGVPVAALSVAGLAFFNANVGPVIGYDGGTVTYLYGYIDGIRGIIGAAKFKGRFAPPTRPIEKRKLYDPHWGKVVLHMPMDGPHMSTVIPETRGHVVQPFGNAALFNSQPAFKTRSSAWFDGNGDYIRVGPSADFNLGSGDFTIEGYWMFSGLAATPRPSLILYPVAGFRIEIAFTTSGTTIYYPTGDGSAGSSAAFAGPISSSFFSHVALVRTGTNLSLFVSGIKRGEINDLGALSAGPWTVDIGGTTGTTNWWHGYIDELRITRGVARYAANFTPPTEPFPTAALQKLSGTVIDAIGNPISRVVRSYRRDTGQLIDATTSDPATGAFELRADSTDEHFVVVFDDSASVNALVFDHVVPVE